MMDAVMYGMIPRKNTETAVERATREQVEEAEHTPRALRLRLQLPDGLEVDVRDGDVRTHPEQEDDEDREQDLVPKVSDPEHVLEARKP